MVSITCEGVFGDNGEAAVFKNKPWFTVVVKDVMGDGSPVAIVVDVDASMSAFDDFVICEIVAGTAMVQKDSICIIVG